MRIAAEAPPRAVSPLPRPAAAPPGSASFAKWLGEERETALAPTPSTLELAKPRRVFGFDALGIFGRGAASGSGKLKPALAKDRAGESEALPPPQMTLEPANAEAPAAAKAPNLPIAAPSLLPGDMSGANAPQTVQSAAGASQAELLAGIELAQAGSGIAEGAAPARVEGATVRDARSVASAIAPADDVHGTPDGPQARVARTRIVSEPQSPVSLTFAEQASGVKLTALAPGLSADLRARLRKACADLLDQFGMKLASLTINGSPSEALPSSRRK